MCVSWQLPKDIKVPWLSKSCQSIASSAVHNESSQAVGLFMGSKIPKLAPNKQFQRSEDVTKKSGFSRHLIPISFCLFANFPVYSLYQITHKSC